MQATRDWFYANWMHAGFVAGLFLIAMLPLLAGAFDLAFLLVYLQLPIYMLHQLEEHQGDRFRRFVNTPVAGGRDALPTPAVVIINVPLVWGVALAAIYLARFVDIGLGLIAVYLTLVNGIVHIAAGLALRAYNPGLVTGVVLFLPASIWALVTVSAMPGVGVPDHALGLALAVLVHIGIIVYVRRRTLELSPRPA